MTHLHRYALVFLITLSACGSLRVRQAGDTGELSVLMQQTALSKAGLRSKIEFFDGQDGARKQYRDMPGARGFYGQAVAAANLTKTLPMKRPIHIWIMGNGAMRKLVSDRKRGYSQGDELRLQMIEVTLTGPRGKLIITGYEDCLPTFEVEGEVEARPAPIVSPPEASELQG